MGVPASDSQLEELRYTSARDRRDRLVSLVDEQGYCTIVELSKIFGVSEMTIRRDVAKLVSEERIRGFHGGVSPIAVQEIKGSQYSHRIVSKGDVKRNIAIRALQLVEENSVIGLDAGTTVAMLANLLPDSGRHLRVVTASLPAVSALAENPVAEVICLGGALHQDAMSFAGPATLSAIANLHIETLFLAASGLNDRGAFCANEFDALTKRALIEVSDNVVLLADSSKFSIPAMVKICGWDSINTLIIDDDLSVDAERMLRDREVEVLKVQARSAAHI
jgi:DeoR family transcriptional regulator, aga operon transcriptional repressor